MNETPVKTILLADDDPMMADLYTRKFTKEGYRIEVAEDEETALAKAAAGRFDIFLMDRMLGASDGIDVLEKIRKIPGCEAAPAYILTNRDPSPEELTRATALGAADYLIKEHIDLNVLASKIKALIG